MQNKLKRYSLEFSCFEVAYGQLKAFTCFLELIAPFKNHQDAGLTKLFPHFPSFCFQRPFPAFGPSGNTVLQTERARVEYTFFSMKIF